jgi:hypothetical protein
MLVGVRCQGVTANAGEETNVMCQGVTTSVGEETNVM